MHRLASLAIIALLLPVGASASTGTNIQMMPPVSSADTRNVCAAGGKRVLTWDGSSAITCEENLLASDLQILLNTIKGCTEGQSLVKRGGGIACENPSNDAVLPPFSVSGWEVRCPRGYQGRTYHVNVGNTNNSILHYCVRDGFQSPPPNQRDVCVQRPYFRDVAIVEDGKAVRDEDGNPTFKQVRNICQPGETAGAVVEPNTVYGGASDNGDGIIHEPGYITCCYKED